MPDDIVDALQIRIEKAKAQLPEATLNAIAKVDWQTTILKLREKRGYTYEQLGDLETETELVLCGLLAPKDYPKELQNRMGISKNETSELVKEMNTLVFSKIKEELIKNTERKRVFEKKMGDEKKNIQTFEKHGIEIVSNEKPLPGLPLTKGEKQRGSVALEKPDLTLPELEAGKKEEEVHPILMQKLSGPFQAPSVTTEHTLENLTKVPIPPAPSVMKVGIPKTDPYRELPE